VRAEIREDEWLAELERLSRKNDKGQTASEIGAAIGRSTKTVRELLQRVKALGRLVIGERTSQRIDGRTATIPVYTIRRLAPILKSVKTRKR
jgi:hypothetical protein